MAMTFTLVSHLRELLSALIQTRAEQRKHAEMEKERLAIEVRHYDRHSARSDRNALDRRKRQGRGVHQ